MTYQKRFYYPASQVSSVVVVVSSAAGVISTWLPIQLFGLQDLLFCSLEGICHIFFQEIFAEMKTEHIKLIYF